MAGTVATVTIPHAVLPPDVAGMLAPGATLAPFGSRVHVRTQIALPTAPAIDEAPLGRSFVYGSDLPPDIDCDAEPAHQACAAP